MNVVVEFWFEFYFHAIAEGRLLKKNNKTVIPITIIIIVISGYPDITIFFKKILVYFAR